MKRLYSRTLVQFCWSFVLFFPLFQFRIWFMIATQNKYSHGRRRKKEMNKLNLWKMNWNSEYILLFRLLFQVWKCKQLFHFSVSLFMQWKEKEIYNFFFFNFLTLLMLWFSIRTWPCNNVCVRVKINDELWTWNGKL